MRLECDPANEDVRGEIPCAGERLGNPPATNSLSYQLPPGRQCHLRTGSAPWLGQSAEVGFGGQGRLSSPGRWYGRSAFISGNAVCTQRLALGARNRLAVMTTDSSDWRKAVIRLLRSLRAGTGPANEALQGSGSEPKAYLASERLGTPNVEST
jgi:hypothetical protein